MASDRVVSPNSVKFGDDFELDLRAYELRHSGQSVKLERIPMDLLLLLVEQRGQLVTRDQIVERIWDKGVFLDTDNSINAAIRKIRQVLKDDPEQPRYVQTVTGRGYRFIAPLEEVSTPPTPPGSSEAQPNSAENLLGKKVSHYRILQMLGGGGMGVVYMAEDLKLGRRVALKFLPGELASDPIAFERLQREARAASALDHPNICSIYQLGEHEGQPFIVMQLLEGQTLREWIETGGKPNAPSRVNELLDFAIQITEGLEAAHHKGIIHRDIKPANIFITSRGQAKILDFGVAKFVELPEPCAGTSAQDPAATNPVLTLTGASMGTPFYLSPEQVRGEKLDARSDLFSLGLVLYEMATSQRTFAGNTAAVIHEAVLNRTVVPARQLNPEISEELEHVIAKALEKDRELRYQNAAQVRADLQHIRLAASPSPADSTILPPAKTVEAAGTPFKNLWRVLTLIAFFTALVSGAFYYKSVHANRLSETDTIVVANFANSTGDPVFDDTLKQGMNIALRQSPFLKILSDDKIAATLKLMTRPADTSLTPDVVREVCQRAGSKAYVAGAIAALGSEYVLGLKAVNCQSGDVMAREQITAPAREKVIAALGNVAAKLRGELGESLSTVQKYDVPLEEATTSSLEALRAFSLAYVEANKGSERNAIPLYKHAIELDPNFAAAYAHLGQAYANSVQGDLAEATIRQAFEHRARASEPEKLYISTRYYELVTGESDKRIEALQLWRRMYPRDIIPANDLAVEYNDMGKFDLALSAAQDAMHLEPDHYTAYEVLGVAYLGLNRLVDAKAIRSKELAANLGNHWTHIDLYGIAVAENDAVAMQREADWAKGKAYEFFMLETIAGVEASAGKLQSARKTYREAMESARLAGFNGISKNMAVDLDLVETMLGNPPRITRASAAIPESDHARKAAARIFAMTGNIRSASMIADQLSKKSTTDTYLNNVWVPSTRAQIEISRGNPAEALELLKVTTPYEFGWKAHGWPSYVRGVAYLRGQKGNLAAAEFQKILDHRGVCLADSLAPLSYALSHLQLARARAMSGDAAGARTAYQEFLTLWKDADPDIPVLKQARAEAAKLQ